MHPVLLARTAREALTAGVLLFFSPPADRLLSLSLGTYNLARERGLSPLDIPQKFVLSALYELPFGAHKRNLNKGWLATQALGGWQENGILNLRSGFPSDTRVARLPPVFTTTNRPIASLASPRWCPIRFDQYFNPKAFAISPTAPDFRGAPIQTFGNAGRMVLRGPASKNLDLSVFKSFRISEKGSLQFRAEAFNLSNTPTFTLAPVSSSALTVGDPAFGKLIGSQTVGRQIQFGLKFLW